MSLKINNKEINNIYVNNSPVYALNVEKNANLLYIWGKQCKLIGTRTLSDGSCINFQIYNSTYTDNEYLDTTDDFTYKDLIKITFSFPSGRELDQFYFQTSENSTVDLSNSTFPLLRTITSADLYENTNELRFFFTTKTADEKQWHIVFAGNKNMTKSSSTTSYTTSTWVPTNYQSIENSTYTRVTASLKKSTNNGTSWTTVKSYTETTGNFVHTPSGMSSQYLNVQPSGLQSRVKSYKSGTKTTIFVWNITKIEQLY